MFPDAVMEKHPTVQQYTASNKPSFAHQDKGVVCANGNIRLEPKGSEIYPLQISNFKFPPQIDESRILLLIFVVVHCTVSHIEDNPCVSYHTIIS